MAYSFLQEDNRSWAASLRDTAERIYGQTELTKMNVTDTDIQVGDNSIVADCTVHGELIVGKNSVVRGLVVGCGCRVTVGDGCQIYDVRVQNSNTSSDDNPEALQTVEFKDRCTVIRSDIAYNSSIGEDSFVFHSDLGAGVVGPRCIIILTTVCRDFVFEQNVLLFYCVFDVELKNAPVVFGSGSVFSICTKTRRDELEKEKLESNVHIPMYRLPRFAHMTLSVRIRAAQAFIGKDLSVNSNIDLVSYEDVHIGNNVRVLSCSDTVCTFAVRGRSIHIGNGVEIACMTSRDNPVASMRDREPSLISGLALGDGTHVLCTPGFVDLSHSKLVSRKNQVIGI